MPVHDAAAQGMLKCLQCLLYHDGLAAGLTLNNSEFLPVHLAAQSGHVTVVQWLIERGMNSPRATTANGNSPRESRDSVG